MPYDPVMAWTRWLARAAAGGLTSDGPAFPHVRYGVISSEPLATTGLSYAVEQAAARANLRDWYTFTSLRVGWIRTALRADTAGHRVAAHVDFRHLESVLLHEHRENLIRHSVAGQLGL